jgi:UDP-N-acetylmuramate--alanine ligase
VLFDEFVDALAKADCVVLLPIYAAREEFDASIRSVMLKEALLRREVAATHYEDIDAVIPALRALISENDVVLCVGAGSVTNVASLLTK